MLKSPACVRPAAERVEVETIGGKTVRLCAYGWSTRRAWGHAAFCSETGSENKVRYYNRTWEARRFDTVLSGLRHKVRLELDPEYAAQDRALRNRRRREAAKARREARRALDAKQGRLAI